MDTPVQERRIYEYFFWSVMLKGLVSAAEVVGGIVILFVPPAAITGWALGLLGDELADIPGDFISTQLTNMAQQFAVSSATFIAIYLLSRGLIKLLLVWALLKNQLWAYPASLVVLGLFVLYQIYQIAAGHSVFVILLTLFDFVVMYFIWREWMVVREHRAGQSA